RHGQTYARLSFTAGPGGQLVLPTAVDWSAWPDCLHQRPGVLESLVAEWEQEYAANVIALPTSFEDTLRGSGIECGWDDRWEIVELPPEEAKHAELHPASS
ncbi:MAG: hypothetical protein JNM56_26010, partial [Planctomycetia bacterium]|nr:hypothetical protein [Planctomycetia bacterium]